MFHVATCAVNINKTNRLKFAVFINNVNDQVSLTKFKS